MHTPQDLITLRYLALRDQLAASITLDGNCTPNSYFCTLLQYAREDGDYIEQAALCMLLAELQ